MDPRIQKAIDLIGEDPTANMSLRALSRQVAMSYSNFSHSFRREVGMSPGRYMRAVRYEAASQLLEARSVKETASLLHISNTSHFIRQFRIFTGKYPSEVHRKAVGIISQKSTI